MSKKQKEARADPLAYLDERLSVAVHEAGHAIAFHALLGRAPAVRIRPCDGEHGRIVYAGWTDYPHTARDYEAFAWRPKRGNPASGIARHARRLRQVDMIISTAGYAAQAIHHRTRLVFGRDDHRNVDAKYRRQNIRVLQGLGEIRSAAELVRDADARTLALLRARWPAVTQLAVTLHETLRLSAQQVSAILT